MVQGELDPKAECNAGREIFPQRGESPSPAKKLTKNQNEGQSEDDMVVAGNTGWGSDDPYGLASTFEPKPAACLHVTWDLTGASSNQSALGMEEIGGMEDRFPDWRPKHRAGIGPPYFVSGAFVCPWSSLAQSYLACGIVVPGS